MTCSRGVKIKADCKIADCEPREWDAVVCPGGMPGAVHLKESETLEALLKKQVRTRMYRTYQTKIGDCLVHSCMICQLAKETVLPSLLVCW